MEILPTLPKVDAVITDPPYGINENDRKVASRVNAAAAKDYGAFDWDREPPSPELMNQVMGAGKWLCLFGGNYFGLPASSCWLVWDKLNSGDFADCELAWTNLPKAVRRLRYLWNGMIRANGEVRGDHPTQKPLGVMAWCLQQLPTGVGSVIDPFMGSGTTGVVCARAGLRFVGIERKTAYFDAACRRIADAYAQPRLFSEPAPKPVQAKLFGDAA
jgi:site-specific DNA-methyltransferase (adenine-specific)/modification methylase